MSNIQQEILNAIDEIQKKIDSNQNLKEKDLEAMLLSALIEEEA
jgi:chorismate mutase